jgi:hypothetical protein
MTSLAADSILSRVFRCGGSFDLVVFDRLPAEEQAVLAELRLDPELYGVLKPHPGSGLTIKAVDRETALLLLTLREPGPLPFFLREPRPQGAAPPAETALALEQLVLDAVLEVEIGGAFVCGPAAATALAAAALEAEDAPAAHPLAELAIAALRHGAAAEESDPDRLAHLLYGFHREPLSPLWAELLPDAEAVLTFLGAAQGSAERRRLEERWELGENERARGWIVFSPRRGEAPAGGAGAGYKLYLSPRAEALPRAFAALVERLAPRPGGYFKVGSDATGVLRPDKLVVYFDRLEELLAVARELEPALAALPAQGVPFSAPIDARGILSWGADPPKRARLVAWQGPESWRLWLARRLAAAMIAAGAASAAGGTSSEGAAWRFALERLRREGVDVERWTPTAALWAAA